MRRDRAHSGWRVIRSRYGDRDSRCVRAPFAIADRVLNRSRLSFPCGQRFEIAASGKRVAAVGADRKRSTVAARNTVVQVACCRIDLCDCDGVTIHITIDTVAVIIGHDVASQNRAVLCRGQIIVRRNGAWIGHRPFKRLCDRFAIGIFGGNHNGVRATQ